MRDLPQRELEAWRPDLTARQAVDFALTRLYADRQHEVTEEVVSNLTFEEVIGALLLARDAIEQAEAGG